MKYIIIGLGNFGTSLATKLTDVGHEVIGVDSNMGRIELIKDKITYAICLDCTDLHALKTLPLSDADVIIVAIGEDFGASILTTAMLKQLKVKKIISRAISPIHQTILEAIGIDEIANPEEDSADRLVKRLELTNSVDFLELSDEYSIIEAVVPERYIGKTIIDIDLRKKYNVNLLTIKRMIETKNILGIVQRKPYVMGVIAADTKLQKNDVIVLFGKLVDIKNVLDA